jgi:uncharacterized protein
MKLQPDKFDVQTISGYGPGWVGIGPERIGHSLVITANGLRKDWQCSSFASLTADHFEQLALLDVELVIFGSGTQLRFCPPAWAAGLMRKRIGLETMDTQAACRTYNILAGEGRSVAAALVVEPAQNTAGQA